MAKRRPAMPYWGDGETGGCRLCGLPRHKHQRGNCRWHSECRSLYGLTFIQGYPFYAYNTTDYAELKKPWKEMAWRRNDVAEDTCIVCGHLHTVNRFGELKKADLDHILNLSFWERTLPMWNKPPRGTALRRLWWHSLGPDNLQPLCYKCHRIKSGMETRERFQLKRTPITLTLDDLLAIRDERRGNLDWQPIIPCGKQFVRNQPTLL